MGRRGDGRLGCRLFIESGRLLSFNGRFYVRRVVSTTRHRDEENRREDERCFLGRYQPGFPILAVFRLKGQPKRDGSIIVRSCKARQSPVYPLNASSRTGLVSTKTPRIRLVVDGKRNRTP